MEAQQASQTLTHFPHDELSALGAWYDQLEVMREWNDKEEDTWAMLGTLNAEQSLSASDIAFLRREIQLARNYEALMVLNARRELARAKELGVNPDPPRPDYVAYTCRS